MGFTFPVPTAPPVSTPTNKIGKINIEKYRIRSVSMISEASWTPKILIRHFDGMTFSYNITREQIESIKASGAEIENVLESVLENVVWTHIKTHCTVYLRKEKLEHIQKLNHVDINL